MSKLFFTFILFLLANFSFSQLNYTLRVITNQGRPKANTEVVLLETKTKVRKVYKTSSSGSVSFTIDSGKEWSLSIGKMRNYQYIKYRGGKGSGSATLTYDMETYNRKNRPAVDRSKLNLVEENQVNKTTARYGNGKSVIQINLKKQNGGRLLNYDIALTCYKLGKTYKANTGKSGAAVFVVPVDNDYEIDIDGVETFSWCDIGPNSMKRTVELTYEPTKIKEYKKGGFIVQELPVDPKPTSARVRVKLTVRGGEHGGVNEDIYLKMIKSNKVYKAKTASDGSATFLLPKKAKYLIDFNFEKDVDVVDLTRVEGFAFSEKTVMYSPDPKLQYPERFIPKIHELVLKDFTEFIDKQYPDPQEDYLDFHLKWGNKFNKSSKEAMLEIGLATKKDPGKALGPPINICFVIDKSGSMSGYDRIEKLKTSLVHFVKQLRASDVVSIVAFESESRVLVSPIKVGDKKHLIDVILSINAGGGTNIYNGLVDGFKQVESKLISGGTNKIVLLTDGYGTTEPDIIVAKAKEYYTKGIELSAVGVGSGYNQALLTNLASAGGGLMHFAGDAQRIEEVFAAELSSVLYPVAKQCNIEVKYNDQIVYRKLYGFPVKDKSSGKFNIEVNNLYPGINKMAMIKFDLINATKALEKKPVIITAKYFDFSKNKEITKTKRAHLEWNEATGELDLVLDKEQKKLYTIAIINQSLKVMSDNFTNGNNKAAKAILVRTIAQVKKQFPNASDKDITELMDRMNGYLTAFNQIAKNGGK